MSGRFAKSTDVSVEKSRAEIERILLRYGATKFAYYADEHGAKIAFAARGRNIRFDLPLPDRTAERFLRTEQKGLMRSAAAALGLWEQECRSLWRALALSIKAKLESVEVGITTFEEEFLAHIVLPDGLKVGETIRPKIAAVYSGQDVPLLPAPTPSGKGGEQ